MKKVVCLLVAWVVAMGELPFTARGNAKGRGLRPQPSPDKHEDRRETRGEGEGNKEDAGLSLAQNDNGIHVSLPLACAEREYLEEREGELTIEDFGFIEAESGQVEREQYNSGKRLLTGQIVRM